MNNRQERPILIVDGLNVFLRHYLVNGTVNDKSEPIGGVVGFIKFLDYIISIHAPQKVFVVWESGGGSSRRKSLYKEYKKDRSKIKEFRKINNGSATMRDQLATDDSCKVQQLVLVNKLLKTTPICQVFVAGAECDDVIAYLVTQKFRTSKSPKIIVSGDKDFYQLLENAQTSIYDPAKKTYVTAKDVKGKYNIAPRNFCLARAIVGDPSDNIGGVPGVGLKTAAKRFPILANEDKDVLIKDIITECKSQVEAKAKQKLYKEIVSCEEIIQRNWKLMYLDSSILAATDITKIEHIVDSYEPKMNMLALIKGIMAAGISIPFDYDQFSSRLRSYMTNV